METLSKTSCLYKLLGGLIPGGLFIIAGRARTGKSALARQFGIEVALGPNPKPVMVFSNESCQHRAYFSWLANISNAHYNEVIDAAVKFNAPPKIIEALEQFHAAPIFITDSEYSVRTLSDLISVGMGDVFPPGIGRSWHDERPKLHIIDHLRLIKNLSCTRPHLHMASIILALKKKLAVERHSAVVATYPLSTRYAACKPGGALKEISRLLDKNGPLIDTCLLMHNQLTSSRQEVPISIIRPSAKTVEDVMLKYDPDGERFSV